ncbi:hypothetical protein WJX73_002475 [Symbiochloris irregularis]|uniref:Uncharacterized protein n=1 Tax=Symbiochloris irregularis TaxID=706552 RepID=A0AAW1PIH4_9CHLO
MQASISSMPAPLSACSRGSSYHFAGLCSTAPRRRQQSVSVRAAAAAPAKERVQLDISKMAPLGDRLLVQPEGNKDRTEGGLLLTAGTTQPIQDAVVGKVLAVGEEVELDVKVGDNVLFSKYSTTDVKVPDGEVCFVAQKSVLATLT